MTDERTLLASWSDGDDAAATALMDRCVDPLARFFRGKVGGPVDDFVQETLVRCLARRASLAPGSSFRAYMFTVARHLLFEHFRRTAKREVLDADAISLADLAPSPSSALRRSSEQRLMQAALREIPLQSQLVLELFYWEELSVAELATVLEIPEGTVKSRLHRARAQLKAKLEAIGHNDDLLPQTLERIQVWESA